MQSAALKDFGEKLGCGRSVSELMTAVASGDLSLTAEAAGHDPAPLIAAVKKSLPALRSVVAFPHSVLRGGLELKRAETAAALSPEGIRATIRDVRLWKKVNGRIRPSDVYAAVNVEEFGVYENRVVRALIDRMLRLLSAEIDCSCAEIRTLRGAHMQFARLNKIDLLRILGDGELLTGEPKTYASYAELDTLRKHFFRLTDSDFYRALSDAPLFTDRVVTWTALFYENENYRACYDLWNAADRFESEQSGLVGEMRLAVYRAFIAIGLIRAYQKLGFRLEHDVVPWSDDGTFAFSGLVLSNGLLKVSLEAADDRIGIVARSPGAKLQQSLIVGLYTDTSVPPDPSVHYAVGYFDIGYDDRFLCVRPEVPDSLENLQALARLTALTFRAGQRIYESICPVCGRTDIVREEHCFRCADCGALYLFPDPETVWINHFRSLNADEERDI